MIGWITRLFGRAEPVLAPAAPRDAASLAVLHAASFNRGWSEHEFEQLLTDRAVVADRAASGRRNVAFIVSRRAADEAEILSVAVMRPGRDGDWRADFSTCICAALLDLGCARFFSRWTKRTRRRVGSTRARGFARSANGRAITRAGRARWCCAGTLCKTGRRAIDGPGP